MGKILLLKLSLTSVTGTVIWKWMPFYLVTIPQAKTKGIKTLFGQKNINCPTSNFWKNWVKEPLVWIFILWVNVKEIDLGWFQLISKLISLGFDFIDFFLFGLGKVYKGEVHVSKTEPVLQVAIKTLKENATLKTQQDFRREVELMSELRHPNIVCLLGIVKRQQPYAMLFEYMTQVNFTFIKN